MKTKTVSFLALLSALVIVTYWALTAFQQPPQQPAPNPVKTQVSDIPPHINQILEEAKSALKNKGGEAYFDLISKAQDEYAKMGKGREALILYATKAHEHGLLREYNYNDLTDYMRAQDSICNVLETKSKEWNDKELLIVKNYILWDANNSDGNPEEATRYLKILETQCTEDQYLHYLVSAYLSDNSRAFLRKGIDILHEKGVMPELKNMMSSNYVYCMALDDIGDEFLEQYDYENALIWKKKAVECSLSQNDSLWTSTYYHTIAQIYETKGDHEKVREYYEKALSYVQPQFPHAFGNYNHHVGASYLEQEHYEKAIVYFKKSLIYWEKDKIKKDSMKQAPANMILGFISSYKDLALAHLALGNHRMAKTCLQQMDSFFLKFIPMQNELSSKNKEHYGWYNRYQPYTHAHYHHSLKEYPQAEKYYKEAIEKADGSYPKAHHQWALMELERGNPTLAADLLQKVLSGSIKNFTPKNVLENPVLADIADKHGTIKPIIHKITALRQCLSADTTNQLDAKAYKNSIRELSEIGVTLLAQVCNSFEREGSTKSLIEVSYQLFEAAIEIHWELYQQEQNPAYLETAFKMAEQSKSILLMGSLRENNALQFAGIPDSLLNQEHLYNNNIAFYEQQLHHARALKNTQQEQLAQTYLREARTGLDELKTRLEKEFPQYFQLKYHQDFAATNDILPKLNPNDLFLEFFEGNNAVYVFGITKEKGLQAHRIANTNGYANVLKEMQHNLTKFDWIKENATTSLQQLSTHGHWLFTQYLSPFWTEKTQRLIIVPDGQFSYLPFEVLLTEPANAANSFNELPYLLHRAAVGYQYSGTLWASPSSADISANQPLKMLAMAASYSETGAKPQPAPTRLGELRQSLAPIEGAIHEVEQLQSRWDGTFLTGAAANERTFKQQAPHFQVLHLAMHGIVDARQPEQSSLAFTNSQDSSEDDFLQAFEIKRLPLKARLVVLSACETGYGKYQHGEGVVSIGRSFMYAGASSLLMSLWSVNDASTAYIMEQFYAQLSQNKTKTEALRQAKIAYIQQAKGISAHPAYWLPFVALGNDAPISIAPASPQNTWWWWLIGAAAVLTGGALFFGRARRL